MTVVVVVLESKGSEFYNSKILDKIDFSFLLFLFYFNFGIKNKFSSFYFDFEIKI